LHRHSPINLSKIINVMYVVQREIGSTTYTKIIIELPMPLYYKIIKPQNITVKNIQQV
jgi:hypothetical protein